MFKKQMKFQKILFSAMLIVSALVFVYGLGLSTDLVGLYQTKAMGGVSGYKVFFDVQDYNHWLIILSIVLILISCVPFVFSSNTRRKYYKGNVIATYVQAAAFIAGAVYIIIETIAYKAEFLQVDFKAYKEMADEMNFEYSESTFFFDAGYVIAAILIISAGLIVYNLIWKNKLMKEEENILAGGNK